MQALLLHNLQRPCLATALCRASEAATDVKISRDRLHYILNEARCRSILVALSAAVDLVGHKSCSGALADFTCCIRDREHGKSSQR
jgi:hypothetical protein